jgi:hypothetical protein
LEHTDREACWNEYQSFSDVLSGAPKYVINVRSCKW